MATAIRIEALPARLGDCLLVECLRPGTRPWRMLVDGGPPDTWPLLAARLERLPVDDRRLDVVVITHIDSDHIGGMLPFFQSEFAQQNVGQVWFNGFQHLPVAGRPGHPERRPGRERDARAVRRRARPPLRLEHRLRRRAGRHGRAGPVRRAPVRGRRAEDHRPLTHPEAVEQSAERVAPRRSRRPGRASRRSAPPRERGTRWRSSTTWSRSPRRRPPTTGRPRTGAASACSSSIVEPAACSPATGSARCSAEGLDRPRSGPRRRGDRGRRVQAPAPRQPGEHRERPGRSRTGSSLRRLEQRRHLQPS